MNRVNCTCGCDCCKKCCFDPCAVVCGAPFEQAGDYAYIYNTAAEVDAADTAVTFGQNGALSGSITHTAGTAEINIGKTGVYLMNYYVQGGDAAAQFTVFRNGEPLAGSTYASTAGDVNGQYILVAQTGDVITLVNTGAAEVTLAAEGAAPEAVVNASVTLTRLF